MNKFEYLVNTFNWIDWIILILCFRAIYKGGQAGIQVSFSRFFRIAFILIACLGFFIDVGQTIQSVTLIPSAYARILAFIVLFVAGYFLLWLVGKILAKIVSISFSSSLDRVGGSVFGFLHYFCLVAFILLFVLLFPAKFTHQQVYKKSFLGKRIVQVVLINYASISGSLPSKGKQPLIVDFTAPAFSSTITPNPKTNPKLKK